MSDRRREDGDDDDDGDGEVEGEPGPSSSLSMMTLRSMMPATRVGVSLRVAPLGDIRGNLAALLGDALLSLLGMFYPPSIGKKANVVVTELIQNVLENIVDPESEMLLELNVDGDGLAVEVRNRATEDQFAAVRARVEALASSADPQRLLGDTLRARRADRLKGGLGLLRLVSENRFRLAARYEQGHLTVSAAFALRGTA